MAALCFPPSPRATARRTFRPSEMVALGLAESRQSYVRGVSPSRKPPKLQQAQPLSAACDRDRALLPSCDTRCWRAELGMRHADLLLREATAGIAKIASALCMIPQCGTWYGCVAVWVCMLVVGWVMRSVFQKHARVKVFRLSFSTGGSGRKSRVFRLDPPVGILSRKKLSRKSPFSTA